MDMEKNTGLVKEMVSFGEEAGKIEKSGKNARPKGIYRDILYSIKKIREHIADIRGKTDLKPGQIWLLDNWYIADGAGVQSSRRFKDAGALPLSKDGEIFVFRLAGEMLKFTDCRVNERALSSYLAGVQDSAPLTEEELYMFMPSLQAQLVLRLGALCLENAGESEKSENIFKNIFTSMGFLDGYDSSALMERVNITEYILSKDPAGVYKNMDERTRHMYRAEVSRLGKKNGMSQIKCAEKILSLSEKEGCHVGEFIFTRPLGEKKREKTGLGYILSHLIPAVAADTILSIYFKSPALFFLCFLPIWEIFKNIADFIILKTTGPKYLPRLDLKKGIPECGKTLCAVSLMLSGPDRDRQNIKNLGKMAITNENAGENLNFAILADLPESNEKLSDKDKTFIAGALSEIEKLNKKGRGQFFLFIRPRKYNKCSGRYMGYERKRGAISALVDYLILGKDSEIKCLGGDSDRLSGTKYIIALDADTTLGAGEATELVGAALHPLNIPVLDEKRKRVVKGAGIIQPRISVKLEAGAKSLFSKVFAGAGGTDPYGSLSSDIYQDVYDSGTFNGKGLINISAYKTCLDGVFPENTVLSHDFLEGSYLKTKFAGDIEFSDGYPFKVLSYYSREHRWIRGDWQNCLWLGKYVKDEKGSKRENPLTLLDKWKIIDNMRRSATPAVNFLSIFFGLLIGSGIMAVWGIAGLFALLTGPFIAMGDMAASRVYSGDERYHGPVIFGLKGALYRLLFNLSFLPYEAYICLGAILTAVYRMTISHKNMLSWVTSADAEFFSQGSLLGHYFKMAVSPISGAVLIIFAGPAALPAGVLWAAAPAIAYVISRISEEKRNISDESRDYLLRQGELIWKFFSENINEKNNYLPPDNVQLDPAVGTAYRTSPTNIGFAILSCLGAADLGITDEDTAFSYIEKMINSVLGLEKYKGHLYNWYDTKTGSVMAPEYISTVDSGNFQGALIVLKSALLEKGRYDLLYKVEELMENMDFSFLYDKKANLYYIGYDKASGRQTENHYDLMSSEARQTSYINVALGAAPKKHWRRLSRTLVSVDGYKGMVSWTGTMFEYLMPNLLLPWEKGSLAYESAWLCLYAQKKRTEGKCPWGISESCYFAFDRNSSYSYEAHGVQEIALKRDMDKKLVISPYSTFLALSLDPEGAVKNLKDLEKLGAVGKYGFYEAVDFTGRKKGTGGRVVKTFMAHHLGMSMTAISNALLDDIMVRRFMANEKMGAYRELLQEKIPIGEKVLPKIRKDVPKRPGRQSEGGKSMLLEKIDYKNPLVFPLTNGPYRVMVWETGQSRSAWNDFLMTRPPEDRFSGGGIDFKVEIDGKIYSLTPAVWDIYNGYTFRYDKNMTTLTYEDEDFKISLETEVFEDILGERRTVRIENKKDSAVSCRILSYFEPVLQREQDFLSHPGFSKLQMEFEKRDSAIIANRRGDDGKSVMSLCFMGRNVKNISTSRADTYGRYDPYSSYPENFTDNFKSSSPENCIATMSEIQVAPGDTNSAVFALSAGFEPETAFSGCLGIMEKQMEERSYDLVSPEDILGILPDEGEYEIPSGNAFRVTVKLVSMILNGSEGRRWDYAPKKLTPKSEVWRFSISGDRPIFIFGLNKENEKLLRDILKAKGYLDRAGVYFDLALMSGYGDDDISAAAEKLSAGMDGVYVLKAGGEYEGLYGLGMKITEDTFKIEGRSSEKPVIKTWRAVKSAAPESYHYGKTGEFIFTAGKNMPYVPWCNILTNGDFGTIVSEHGGGFMWCANSQENKINVWQNDKAGYNTSEDIKISIDGTFYSVFAGNDGLDCNITYGQGWAMWEKKIGTATVRTRIFVPREEKGKIIIIDGENIPAGSEISYYTDLILASRRSDRRYVVTDYYDGWIRAYNRAGGPFSTEPFIIRSSSGIKAFTTDKSAWLYKDPDGFTGTDMDPCVGMICDFEGSNVFVMGCEDENSLLKFSSVSQAEDELEAVKSLWGQRVSKIQVETGNEGLDNYVNAWGVYQTVAGRLFGRTSNYQNSGAFGFRDQLQDCVCLGGIYPELLRRQIIRCCAHQFVEGDGQHWWHPGSAGPEGPDPGVRTLCSDDYMWLPYALCRYYEITGDREFLFEDVYYLQSPMPDKKTPVRYEIPQKSQFHGNVLDHAMRACELIIRRGFGSHGLCKILDGDWNDGMDMVGKEGRGESVWLTFFASIVFRHMADLCRSLGFHVQSENYRLTSDILKKSAEATFSGGWYLRGYYDEGKPLGKRENEECKIDSISQSFAQFAGADMIKTKTAIFNAYNMLFDEKYGILKLFTPAFDKGPEKPGYIKRCSPGFRENGGQYTHGALWLCKAMFETGEPDWAYRIIKTMTEKNIDIYKAEPYVVAADVYSAEGSYGRAGWTWYTGSAGWLYRVITESMLGIKIKGGRLYIEPCLPGEIESCHIVYRADGGEIDIRIKNSGGEYKIQVDGKDYDKAGYDILSGKKYALNGGKI